MNLPQSIEYRSQNSASALYTIIFAIYFALFILGVAVLSTGCSDPRDEITAAPEDEIPEVKKPLVEFHPADYLTTELRSAPILSQETHPTGWNRANCLECHRSPLEEINGVCIRCHGENKPIEAESLCSACHKTQSKFGDPASGSHQAHVARGIKDTTCERCHPGGPELSVSHANAILDIRITNNGVYTPPAEQDDTLGSCSNITCHQDVREWGGDCSSCHYNPPDTGRHKEHLEQEQEQEEGHERERENVSCQSCHSGNQHDSDKTSGKIELGGIEYDAITGDCASACHDEPQNWTCLDCHGYPPDTGNHAASAHAVSCGECHNDHDHSYKAATRPLDFSESKVSFAQGGNYESGDNVCSGISCHGDDRVWGASCTDCHSDPPETGVHILHVQEQNLKCQDCHSDNQHDLDNDSGSIELGGIEYDSATGNCVSTCHAQQEWGCTDCHSFPPDTGNHLAHNESCEQCHQGHDHSYKAAVQPNDFTDTQVSIAHGGQFDSSDGSCSGIPCHESRTWGANCAACHGNPPETSAHVLHVKDQNLKCQDCHADNQHDLDNNSGSIELGGIEYDSATGNCASTCHIDRKWSCTDCHGYPPNTGNHSDHESDCTQCHQNHQHSYKAAVQPSDFTDTQVSIAHGGQFDPGDETCSGISCHGDARVWGSSCTDCHSDPPETGSHILHIQDQNLKCQDCHADNQHDLDNNSGSIELGGIEYDSATGDCASTCHERKRWNCTDCHGDPPDTGNHSEHESDCRQCHENHEHSYKSAITPGDFSSVETDFAGNGEYDPQSGTCSSVECHPDLRVWGSSCTDCHSNPPETGSHILHVEQGEVRCYDCHADNQHDLDNNSGSIELGGIEYDSITGDCASTCHERQSWNCTECHDNPPDTGNHPAHNEPSGKFFAREEGTELAPVSCGECHSGHQHSYRAALTPNDFSLVHVEFAQGGVFDAADSSCSNMACHEPMKWGGSCSDCHASPPETGLHLKHIESGLNCTQCHEGNQHDLDVNSGFIEVGGIDYDGTKGGCTSECHAKQEVWDCASCHQYPPDAGQHEAHASFDCNMCHQGNTHTYKAATAPNDFKNVEVDFAIAGDWNKATSTCNNVGCHDDRQW